MGLLLLTTASADCNGNGTEPFANTSGGGGGSARPCTSLTYTAKSVDVAVTLWCVTSQLSHTTTKFRVNVPSSGGANRMVSTTLPPPFAT